MKVHTTTQKAVEEAVLAPHGTVFTLSCLSLSPVSRSNHAKPPPFLTSCLPAHNNRTPPLPHCRRFRMATTTTTSPPAQQDKNITPGALRLLIRAGHFTGNTAGCCPGYVHANLVILPQEHALNFMTFCVRNPKPCPLLDVTDPGDPHPPAWLVKGDADLRTDLPKYRGTCVGQGAAAAAKESARKERKACGRGEGDFKSPYNPIF